MDSAKKAIVVVIILVLAFALYYKDAVSSWLSGSTEGFSLIRAVKAPPSSLPASSSGSIPKKEGMTAIQSIYPNYDQEERVAEALGYTSEMPWDEHIAATQVDQSVHASHMDFVKDVRRFSSGANFTSVADDNGSPFFTNFIGLRRPQHVPIGADARSIPDVDESVLQRNGPKGFY